MKAAELRIGNYVYTDNEYIIKSYSPDGLFNILTKIENYKPIPLTEEWLLKFGFEDLDTYLKLDFGKLSLVYYVDGEKLYLFIDNGEECGSFHLKHIKSVHQLQNLYFALTGKELTI